MSVSVEQFWQLLSSSQLFTPQQCQQLVASFDQVKGASQQGNAKTLSEWLISQNYISRYQATVLLAGQPGPFYYGDYKVYDRVEEGALQGAFRAVHATTNHPVVLRFVTGAALQDPQAWTKLVGRVQSLQAAAQPNLQQTFEVVDLQSYKFFAQEDVAGQSLEQSVGAGPLPAPDACRVARGVALALVGVHQAGSVYGDLRPSNVMQDGVGHAKLLYDPASAPTALDTQQLDPSGVMLQRADYSAPELAQPGKLPDAQTDIYALGCLLYQMLVGQPPFAGGDAAQKIARHAAEPIPSLEAAGISAPLSQLVSYMTAKQPTGRYQQASVVAEQLAPFMDPQQLHAQPAPSPATIAAYEQAIQNKQTQSQQQAAVASAASAAVAPVVAVGAVAAGRAGAGAVTTSRSRTDRDLVPDENPRDKAQTKQLAIILGTIGTLLIALFIGLHYANKKPIDETAAGGSAGDGQTTIGGGTDGGDGSGTGIGADVTGGGGTVGAGGQTVAGGSAIVGNGTGTAVVLGNGPRTSGGTRIGVASGGRPSGGAIGVGTSPVGGGPIVAPIADDDGRMLWASPTAGTNPISFKYVPLAPLLFVVARPADILQSPDGQNVLKSLGPRFEQTRSRFEAAAGVPLSEIEQLIISYHQAADEFPQPSYVVRLNQSKSEDQLKTAWDNPSSRPTNNGDNFYIASGRAYYIPPDSGGNVFAMGPIIDIENVADRRGAAPPSGKGIEPLRRASDVDRHVTFIFRPHDLTTNFFRDGRQWYFQDPQRARRPLDWLLRDDVKTGMLSLHFGNTFYTELRMYGDLGLQGQQLASAIRARTQQLQSNVEDALDRMNVSSHWSKLSRRLPMMVNFLHEHSRVGADGDQAIVNAYLPGPAAHNLMYAGSMMIEQPSGGAIAVAPTTTPKGPASLDEALKTVMSLKFDQMSLEFAMKAIEDDFSETYGQLPFPFAVKIIGGDLELNGITRNQQVRGFDQPNKPLADILTALVMKANPVATVKAPSEVDQKLIWVTGPSPDDATKQIILITTRDAAASKGYTLPQVFQP